MSIFERSVTCSFFFRNCTHILTRTQRKKFEDMFLVKIANKGTSLNRPFLHLSMADNVIAFRCSSVIYPRLLVSPSHFQYSLSIFSIEIVNGIPLWDFYVNDSQRALKINNHSRIIYRNDNIARLVKT